MNWIARGISRGTGGNLHCGERRRPGADLKVHAAPRSGSARVQPPIAKLQECPVQPEYQILSILRSDKPARPAPQHARRLEEADLAVATRLQAEPRQGMLRVNAPMSFGTLHLGPAIADFMQKYPALHIQLIISDQQIDAVQEGFDVTLRIAELASSTLVARKIGPRVARFARRPLIWRSVARHSIPTICAITLASPTVTSRPATNGNSPVPMAITRSASPGRCAATTRRCCATRRCAATASPSCRPSSPEPICRREACAAS